MSETTYYQRNREVMLNRANEYYQNNKVVLREKSRNKYRELSKDKQNIKREYGRNRYYNMSEEDKQRLKEYQKNYRESEKSIQFFYYIKMKKELVFNNGHNNYSIDKNYF